MNLYKKESPWTDWEIEYLKNNYMEMHTRDIANHLNRTMCAIELKARKLGLQKFPYSCNYHFFDAINTEEKAYWLGFLIADGWTNKNPETGSGTVGIELQYSDINHLKKFNKSIQGNYKINDRWRECGISKSSKKHHTCVIRIYSRLMYDALEKLGFCSDKTYSCNIPELSKNLLPHFIRGYFDGDGIFCLTNKSFHIDFITASENLYTDLKCLLESLNIKYSVTSQINEFDTFMYRIYINSNSDKIKFLNYIYKDSNIYLERKYKKYLKAIEKYQNNAQVCLAS